MSKKPRLVDPDMFRRKIFKTNKKPGKSKRVTYRQSSPSFNMDIILIILFLLFGLYLYFYRKMNPQEKQQKTRLQLQQIQKLNYQYFTKNS